MVVRIIDHSATAALRLAEDLNSSAKTLVRLAGVKSAMLCVSTRVQGVELGRQENTLSCDVSASIYIRSRPLVIEVYAFVALFVKLSSHASVRD